MKNSLFFILILLFVLSGSQFGVESSSELTGVTTSFFSLKDSSVIHHFNRSYDSRKLASPKKILSLAEMEEDILFREEFETVKENDGLLLDSFPPWDRAGELSFAGLSFVGGSRTDLRLMKPPAGTFLLKENNHLSDRISPFPGYPQILFPNDIGYFSYRNGYDGPKNHFINPFFIYPTTFLFYFFSLILVLYISYLFLVTLALLRSFHLPKAGGGKFQQSLVCIFSADTMVEKGI